MTGYTDARQTVADALQAGVGDDWYVMAAPVDRIGDQAILVAGLTDEAMSRCLWRRTFIVGVIARRNVVEETHDLFDQVTPLIRSTIEHVTGATYGKEQSKRVISTEVAGTEYLMQTHEITIETSN